MRPTGSPRYYWLLVFGMSADHLSMEAADIHPLDVQGNAAGGRRGRSDGGPSFGTLQRHGGDAGMIPCPNRADGGARFS
jgi:hypothetical protein